jgi:hypothetical protein
MELSSGQSRRFGFAMMISDSERHHFSSECGKIRLVLNTFGSLFYISCQ